MRVLLTVNCLQLHPLALYSSARSEEPGSVELTDKERKARAILDKVQQLGDGSLIRDIKQLLKKLIRSDEFEAICKMPEEAGELLRTPKGKTFTLSLPKIGSQVLS